MIFEILLVNEVFILFKIFFILGCVLIMVVLMILWFILNIYLNVCEYVLCLILCKSVVIKNNKFLCLFKFFFIFLIFKNLLVNL